MQTTIPDYIINPTLPITITVVGVGGSGSMFLKELARVVYAYQKLYRRKIVVIACDGDNVTDSNVARQAFGANEVGENKAHLLVSRINRFYGFQWLSKPTHFTYQKDDTSLYAELSSNFLVSAVDSTKARIELKRFFDGGQRIKNNPEYFPYFWIDMGNTKDAGQIVVGSRVMEWPNVIDAYGAMLPKKDDDGPSCSLAMALNRQDLFINAQSALVAAKWLWECLTNKEMDWRGAFINLSTFTIRKLKVTTDAPAKGTDTPKQQDKPGSEPAGSKRRIKPAKKRNRKDRAGSRPG